MYRFNSADGRLERLLECTMMIMEALAGYDEFEYSIVGHSGDGAEIPLVEFGETPSNRKERLAVLQRMVAHSQYCYSGDHTVEACAAAVKAVRVSGEEAGLRKHCVFALSDANLRRYGIHPGELANALTSDDDVSAHLVMIASLSDEANRIKAAMPPGAAAVCLDTTDLPQLIKSFLASSIDGDQ